MSDKPDYTGENLAFIVGCPRSGTTWLQRLLASHPKVRTGHESYLFLHYIGPQLRGWQQFYRDKMGLACYFTEEQFLSMLRSYLLLLLDPMVAPLKPGEIFVEKTPAHTLFIPEIMQMLPKARIIHILRDPRDVVASMNIAARGWAPALPRRPSTAARKWVKHVAAARLAQKHLSSEQFLEVRYEDLSESTVHELRRCCEFLGLSWSDEEMAKAISANQANGDSSTAKGTPIPLGGEVGKNGQHFVQFRAGFARNAKPGGWRKDLNLWGKLWVWLRARRLMAEVGYRW